MHDVLTVLGGLCITMAIRYWVHRRKLRRIRAGG